MASQSQKKEVRDSHEADFQSSQPNIKKQSELIKNLYYPIMDKIQSPSFNILAEKLNQCGIYFEQTNFSAVFSKSCIETNWESTLYEVRFGNLRTHLKVIYFELDSNFLCNNLLGSGGFGQVMRFKTSAGQFALKNIRYRKNRAESVDLALQEVFMAKVLSALDVGPKFVKIFSYDSIVFKNCVQFVMEMCRTKFQKQEIENELKERDLLMLLKTMHGLRICHLDIKNENIAWSSSLNRFVFLDFTFTKFIKEPVGFKTETNFEGTFHYASPEMQKRCILQDKQFVDLYYNDLHCLESTWKQMESDLQVIENIFIEKISEGHLKMADKTSHNDSIVNYFNLKMGLFEQNIEVVSSLAQKQKILLKTFSAVITKHKINQIHLDSNPLIFEDGRSDSDNKNEIDDVLLRYELSIQGIPQLVTLLEIIEDGSQSLFEQAWQEDSYKQKMFFFIDVYSNPVLQNQKLRKSLVNKIYCQITTDQSEASQMLRFRKVIEYYGIYFGKKKNIEVVEKIMSYFVLMHDRQSRKKLEDMVLSILEQQEDYSEYSERNYKYFLGEIGTMNPMSTWHYERYIENSQNLIQKLSKKTERTDSLMLEISETHRLMKKVRNYRLGSLYKVMLEEEMKQIESLLAPRNCEIREFTYQALQYSKAQNVLLTATMANQSEFKDHFLQKCAVQITITNCIMTERAYSLKFIIESENFLNKFEVLVHLSVLNIYNETENIKRKEICANYLKIYKDSAQDFSDQYFKIVRQMHNSEEAASYLLNLLSQLKLSRISNLDRLQNFKIILRDIIYFFLNMKVYSKQNKMPFSAYQKLGEMVQLILQHNSDICQIQKRQATLNNSPRLNETIYFKQKILRKLKMQDLFLKGLMLVLLNKEQQALTLTLQIIDESIQREEYLLLFGLISFIEESVKEDCHKRQVSKVILKLSPYLFGGEFCENLIQSTLCLQIILRAYQSNGLASEAFDCIRKLCCYNERKKINIACANLLKSVARFAQTCNKQEIKQFVQTTIRCQLSDFIPCPVMSYVLYEAEFFLRIKGVVLELSEKKRMIVVMVMFARAMPQGLFGEYRQLLYQESHLLNGKRITTLSQLRKMASRISMKVFLEPFLTCRKSKNKNLVGRQIVDVMTSCSKTKAQNYYEICVGMKKVG